MKKQDRSSLTIYISAKEKQCQILNKQSNLWLESYGSAGIYDKSCVFGFSVFWHCNWRQNCISMSHSFISVHSASFHVNPFLQRLSYREEKLYYQTVYFFITISSSHFPLLQNFLLYFGTDPHRRHCCHCCWQKSSSRSGCLSWKNPQLHTYFRVFLK